MNGVRPSGATTTSVRSPPMKPKLVPAGVSKEYIYHIEDNPKKAALIKKKAKFFA